MAEEKKILNVQQMINEFMDCAKSNIAPLDPLAFQAIASIVGMVTINLARLNNINVGEIIKKAEETQQQKQNELENIMQEVNAKEDE